MKDSDTPKVLRYYNRVILWGCVKERDQLFAGLIFFNRMVTSSLIALTDINGEPVGFSIELPFSNLNQKQRSRAQNLTFKVIETN